MNRIVLDASAILALIGAEVGAEKLIPALLDIAVASAVNLSEVHARLIRRGWTADQAWLDATSTIRKVFPFDEQQAKLAGDLILQTKPLGLSLADRACLVLGMVLGAPVFTTDRTWQKLKLDVEIHTIR